MPGEKPFSQPECCAPLRILKIIRSALPFTTFLASDRIDPTAYRRVGNCGRFGLGTLSALSSAWLQCEFGVIPTLKRRSNPLPRARPVSLCLDCLVGSAVAASIQGALLFETDLKTTPKRDRVGSRELQRKKNSYLTTSNFPAG